MVNRANARIHSTVYEGNIVLHSESVGDVVIDKFGTFNFGHLTPGVYDLRVT